MKKGTNTGKLEEVRRNKKPSRKFKNKQMKTNCATLLINLNKEPTLKKGGKESRTAKANVYQPSLDKKILEETESYLRKRQKQ